jgi:hypothetical protein
VSESKWKVGETYKLRNGSVAVILDEHEGRLFGRFFSPVALEWMCGIWTAQSGTRYDCPIFDFDLMPPPAPRVTQELWMNVYGDDGLVIVYNSRRAADYADKSIGLGRHACISIALDVPVRYGLDKDQPPILVRAG